MKLNWNFPGEGRVQNKKPSMGGVWLFSGTAHWVDKTRDIFLIWVSILFTLYKL